VTPYIRRPRTPTIVAMVVFLVAFVFWLFEPQPEREIVRYPDLSWVIVTTTTVPPVETTAPPETVPVETVPPETVPPEPVPEETVPVETLPPETVPSAPTTVQP
jgi:hypothetical protein